MAQSNKNAKGSEANSIDDYRIQNARETNKKRFPDSYLYLLHIEELNLVKIGVSKNPHRRIKDIRSSLPFDTTILKIYKCEDAYKLEEKIHNMLKSFYVKHEWFILNRQNIDNLITFLKKNI